MKFFKLLTVFAIAVVQGAKVLNFTQYDYEWVKGKEYNLQYTYLEEPSFSNFQIRLYNSTNSITLTEVSTSNYNDEDIHSLTLPYPEASTGRYKIVGLSNGSEISNNFSVKLVLKASPEATSAVPSPTSTPTDTDNSLLENKKEDGSNIWKIIAIIVSIIVVLLILAILGVIFYNRYKRNKQYEVEANTSIWKVPVSEKSIIAGNINAYNMPSASLSERDLSFSSELDELHSYNSQYRSPDYFSVGYRERRERPKSVHSLSTKASNNILDILYPSNEKKEKSLHEKSLHEKSIHEKSIHEKSIHEKSEISIDIGHSHSQKNTGKRKKYSNNNNNNSNGTSNGQLRNARSKSSDRMKVHTGANSLKVNTVKNKRSRISLAESKKSKISIIENEKNTNSTIDDEIHSNVNKNDQSPIIINEEKSIGISELKSISSPKSEKETNDNNSPEYYIKHTKLNKKYIAIMNFKPKLNDEMSVSKNDVIVVKEVFTDGWGLGKNLITEKEGLLPLNCLEIEAGNWN